MAQTSEIQGQCLTQKIKTNVRKLLEWFLNSCYIVVSRKVGRDCSLLQIVVVGRISICQSLSYGQFNFWKCLQLLYKFVLVCSYSSDACTSLLHRSTIITSISTTAESYWGTITNASPICLQQYHEDSGNKWPVQRLFLPTIQMMR